MRYEENVLNLIGRTPLVRVNHPESQALLLAKLEYFNPGSSVKDRLALSLVEAAESEGKIRPGSVIIEPTSGNTGIGLAMVCAVKGYSLIIVMPENMSIERRRLIAAYGAKLVLTPASLGMKGAIQKAAELQAHTENSFMPLQFNNPANPAIHRQTTAEEIWLDTDGKIDIFVAGVGTGGTITGVGEILKKYNPAIQIIAVEPALSPVLSGGTPGPHKIQGIGAGFVPEILNRQVIDEIYQVTTEEAVDAIHYLAVKQGILSGISSGAVFSKALKLAQKAENRHKNIVFMVADNGERYLSESYYANEV